VRELKIAVLPGDGIGVEVIDATLPLLAAAVEPFSDFTLTFTRHEAGAGAYLRTGVALPPETLDRAREADAILLGAMGLPEVRYPDGTELVPQIELRERLDLYAGVRPLRAFAGVPTPLADARATRIDCVIVRESTEGLFAARTESRRDGDAVLDTMRVSRSACERLFRFAFELARQRRAAGYPGRVTSVDKANVLPSMAYFRQIFLEVASRYPDVAASSLYVDAAGLQLVRAPWQFDVLVTENMFGDILSDVGAALIGGMGMAPSADIGDRHGVFQPCHGTAPDIAGRGMANPTAMVLSAAMMLEWLGHRHHVRGCLAAASRLVSAVELALASGDLISVELGGSATTAAFTRAFTRAMEGAE
jgi:3-isopropylmalate dehydrogenase